MSINTEKKSREKRGGGGSCKQKINRYDSHLPKSLSSLSLLLSLSPFPFSNRYKIMNLL